MNNKGFTLIEIMVAVSIFSIVVVIIGGALITATTINRQAQATKLVVDNLNFAMDSLLLSLRDGKYFQCKTNIDNFNFNSYSTSNPQSNAFDCDDDGEGVVFLRIRHGVEQKVAYRFNAEEGTMEFAVGSSGQANFIDMTSPEEVEITAMEFRVINSQSTGGNDRKTPRLLVTVAGQTKDKTQAKFYLQSSVSARL